MAFAYTLSELQFHNRRFLWAGLGLSAALLLLWALWFLLAPISLYESSQGARVQADGTVQADVAPGLLGGLYLGQPALYRVSVAGDNQTLTGRVAAVDRQAGTATIQLRDVPVALRPYLLDGVVGRVDFETRRATPAQLVLGAVGTNA